MKTIKIAGVLSKTPAFTSGVAQNYEYYIEQNNMFYLIDITQAKDVPINVKIETICRKDSTHLPRYTLLSWDYASK